MQELFEIFLLFVERIESSSTMYLHKQKIAIMPYHTPVVLVGIIHAMALVQLLISIQKMQLHLTTCLEAILETLTVETTY